MSIPIHFDCVACQARANQVDGETNALVILMMLLVDGCTGEGMQQDLCFEHRRRLQEGIKNSLQDKS